MQYFQGEMYLIANVSQKSGQHFMTKKVDAWPGALRRLCRQQAIVAVARPISHMKHKRC